MKNKSVKKIVCLALFLALGIILNIVESLVPLPFAIPGIKLGLANTMGLVVLYFYGPREYVEISLLRVFLVGLLRTGIASPAFFISLGGCILAIIFSLILYFTGKSSIFSLSVISSLFHQVGQVIVVSIIYSMTLFINYLPFLLMSGFITGILIAFVSGRSIRLLMKIF